MMNRLLAYRFNRPERLRSVLRSHPDALPVTSSGGSDKTPVPSDAPAAGTGGAGGATATALRWGTGFFVGHEPLVQRYTEESSRGATTLMELKSQHLLAQVAQTPKGRMTMGAQTSSPYRFRRFLLAAQGDLPVLQKERQALLAELPDFLRNNVRSHDPAEALLHLLLLRLYEADPGYVNQPDLPPEVALAALGQVLSEAAGKPVEDAPPQVQHVLLASGQWLLCARRGPQPLWFRELRGLGDDQSFAAVLVHAELHKTADAAAAEEAAIAAGALEVPDNHALLIKANLGHLLVPLSL